MVDPNTPPAASDTKWQNFPTDTDHSLTWVGVRGDICQNSLDYKHSSATHVKQQTHLNTHACMDAQAWKHTIACTCVCTYCQCTHYQHTQNSWFKCQKQQQWKKVGWGTSRLIYPWIRSGQISPIINKWLTFPCCEVYKPQGSSRTQQGLDSIPAVYQCEQKQPLATNTWGDKPRMVNRVKPMAPPTLIYSSNLKMLSLIFRLNQPFCYHNIIHTAILLATFCPLTFSFCPSNSPVTDTHVYTEEMCWLNKSDAEVIF